jgi:hypothetical protein
VIQLRQANEAVIAKNHRKHDVRLKQLASKVNETRKWMRVRGKHTLLEFQDE